MQRRAVFAGVARDCAAHLPGVLANLERLSALYDEVAFCFVENDSKDNTASQLFEWGRNRREFYLFNLDGLGLGRLGVRTLRLEYARNLYLSFVRSHPYFDGFDQLVVIDMDDAGGYPIDPGRFEAAQSLLDCDTRLAGVFANQIGTYYDLWALREPGWCPDDIWLTMAIATLESDVSDELAYERHFVPRIRSIDPSSAPIEVDSAFGGLGIYRLSAIRTSAANYHGAQLRAFTTQSGKIAVVRMQQCEHVALNLGLRAAGHRLCIVPGLLNRVFSANVRFPAGAFRQLIF